MLNSPVNFNDPTGHESVCGQANSDPECGDLGHSLLSHPKNPTKPVVGPKGRDEDTPDKNNPAYGDISLLDSDNVFVPSQDVYYPFTNGLKLPNCPIENGCSPHPYPSYLPYELQLHVDIFRINPDQLAWDLLGVGIALLGIKSTQNAIDLNVKAVNYMTITYTGLSVLPYGTPPKVDNLGLATTVVGLYPPVAVGASSFSITRDLSAAIYKVKVNNLLFGPPKGPYCDGKYGC